MRRYLIQIGIVGAVLTVLVFYFFNLHRQWTKNEVMNRVQIARMLALMRYDPIECENVMAQSDEGALPEDIKDGEWYGKYAAAVLNDGWMELEEDGLFHPFDAFTYKDLKYLMEKFHIAEDLLSFSIRYRQSDGMVSKKQWCEFYQLLIVDNVRVQRKQWEIHGSPSNILNLGAWQVLTDDGVKSAEGLSVDLYMDKKVEVYVAGNELLCMIDVCDAETRIENVWIKSNDEGEFTVFFDGYERIIPLKKVDQRTEANMADLTFNYGKLTGISYKADRVNDALVEIRDSSMVLEKYGEVTTTDGMVIYQIYPEPEVIGKDRLATDGTQYEFVLEGNSICGVIYQAYAEETIRILLHDQDNDYEHSSVLMTSDEAFLVIGDDSVKKYEAGSEFAVKTGDIGGDEKEVIVRSENKNGKITLLSLERNCGQPSYHGEIHLQEVEDGILIINQVNIEDYVAGVVPGEMPVSYGEEALKVQAVCARTFARRALGGNFRGYPANLDDTVASQVYNNREECEESIRATDSTRGQVLQNNEGLTPTYFFSTSCGHTSDPEDVWYEGEADSDSATVSVFLSDDSVELDLSSEKDFRRFINLEDDHDYFEEDLNWFRWQVFIPAEDIQNSVRKVGETDIGVLENIDILERAESGVLKSVRIQGSKGEYTVYGEYRIRQIFSPENSELIPQSGEKVTGWSMLPSGYFYMDAAIEEDICVGYLIHGGGYGHGCGMSQNGAMKMSEMGKTYDEILKYFFPDSELISE